MAAQGELTYLAIGRVAVDPKQSKLILSFAPPAGKSEKSKNEGTCKQVLEKADRLKIGSKIQLNNDEKTHIVLAQADYADPNESSCKIVVFAIVTTAWTQAKSANELLRDFREQFIKSNSTQSIQAAGTSDSGIMKKSEGLLQTIVARHGNDKLAEVQAKTDAIKNIMEDNVSKALGNVENLKQMEENAEDLLGSAKKFEDKSGALKKKFCQQYWKVTIAIVLIILLILIIVVASVCAQTGKCKSSSS